MKRKPLVTITKHSVLVTAELLDLIHAHASYVARHCRHKLESPDLDETLRSRTAQEAERVELFLERIEEVRAHLQNIYTWHFEKLAEVFKRTLQALVFGQIEHVHTLKVMLDYTVEMLKAENPRFSQECGTYCKEIKRV